MTRTAANEDVARAHLQAEFLRATALMRDGDRDEALRVLSAATESIGRTFGTHSLEYADALVATLRIDATSACVPPSDVEQHLRRSSVLEQAAAIQESLGAAPTIRLGTLSLLAACLHRAGQYEDSELVLRSRLRLAEAALGPSHLDTGFAARALALAVADDRASSSRERWQEALSLTERSIMIAKALLASPDDARRAKFLYYMATDDQYELLIRLGREAAVEESLAAVLLEVSDYGESALPPGPIFRCRNVAVALARMGRVADALPLLARAVSEMSRSSERLWEKLDEDRELLDRLKALSSGLLAGRGPTC